jgi:hypothetical protein
MQDLVCPDEGYKIPVGAINATGFKLGLLVNFGRYPKLER